MSYNLIAVDFDGTIAEYSGWKGVGKFGKVLPGAREALREFKRRGKRIIINTSRGETELLRAYLRKNKVPFDYINQNPPDAPKNLSTAKVIADIYIDDRAINFRGSWPEMVRKVSQFKNWYAGEPTKEGKTDVNKYDRIASLIFKKDGQKFSGCFPSLLNLAAQIFNTDIFTPEFLVRVEAELDSCLAEAPASLAAEARDIFAKKNTERGGLWREVGLNGAAIEIHGKLARLSQDPTDHDSAVDLINYLIIAKMCIQQKLLRPSPPKNAILTGTANPQGLGRVLKQVLALNGFERIYEINPSYYSTTQDVLLGIAAGFNKVMVKKIDLVINNFGINKLAWIGTLDYPDFSMIDANLKVPLAVVDELVRYGLGPCRIINVASQTYRVPQRCTSIYSATKAGLVQMTKVMARELAPKGYVVNSIAPGAIEDTTMHRLVLKDLKRLRKWKRLEAEKIMIGNIPAGRFTNRSEVAVAILRIARLPDYVNGAVIEMTGGQ